MQTPRITVAFVRELTSGVKPGENHLNTADFLTLVLIYGHTATVVCYRHGLVFV